VNIDKIAEELGEALCENSECDYARRFLARVNLEDGRTARLDLVLRVEKDDPLD